MATPKFAPEPKWREISGLGRSKNYELFAAGILRGVKVGRRLLIDVEHGLEYLRSLPPAEIRPRTTLRRRSAVQAADAAQPETVESVQGPSPRARTRAEKSATVVKPFG